MGLPQILLKLYLLIATPILRKKNTPIMLEKKSRHVLAGEKNDLARMATAKMVRMAKMTRRRKKDKPGAQTTKPAWRRDVRAGCVVR